MHDARSDTGSATRWGPLFGPGAEVWADTWEGPQGWGAPAYEQVISRAGIGPATRVLDCGCGAGRFARLAADAGADVAGIDASPDMVEIAAARTPTGEFVVGDIEALPWEDDTFDVVTGFSSFQFADDKVQALVEARRVARRTVAVVIPTRVANSGFAVVLGALVPLFAADALESLKRSGINALSEPGKLDNALATAGLQVDDNVDIECPSVFHGPDDAVRAFLAAGPVNLATRNAGEAAVAAAIRHGVGPLTGPDGMITLSNWFRVAITSATPPTAADETRR